LIQYVWITLYGVAILEVTLSRYIFQVDKAPVLQNDEKKIFPQQTHIL